LRLPGAPSPTGNTIYGVVGRVKFEWIAPPKDRNIVSRKSPVTLH